MESENNLNSFSEDAKDFFEKYSPNVPGLTLAQAEKIVISNPKLDFYDFYRSGKGFRPQQPLLYWSISPDDEAIIKVLKLIVAEAENKV